MSTDKADLAIFMCGPSKCEHDWGGTQEWTDDNGVCGMTNQTADNEELDALRRKVAALELELLPHREEAERRRRESGDYWLTVEGRAQVKELWPNREDGNACRPLLDALEAAESQLQQVKADAERWRWIASRMDQYGTAWETTDVSFAIDACDPHLLMTTIDRELSRRNDGTA